MIKSIKKTIITTIIIEKSKFICTLVPVNSNDSALEQLKLLQIKYHDANHNCYAYILNNGSTQKCSDDGEPSRTAGIPILQALLNNNLDNVLCVVTRYFGGIKLGAGGLVRAYSKSAMESINNAQIVQYVSSTTLEISFDFTHINKIEQLINKFNVEIKDKMYLEKVTYTLNINNEYKTNFINEVISVTKNNFIITNEQDNLITL